MLTLRRVSNGCTRLCVGCTRRLRSARARACAQVGGDNLEFAVAHLLRPGAAVGHVLNAGSVADNNKRYKEAAQAGTGPRFTEILAHVSSACARPRARALLATNEGSGIRAEVCASVWLCLCVRAHVQTYVLCQLCVGGGVGGWVGAAQLRLVRLSLFAI